MHYSIDQIRSYPIGSFTEIGYAWTLIVIKRQLRDCKKRTSKLETNRNNGVTQQGVVKASSFVSNSEGTTGLSIDDEQQTTLNGHSHYGTALTGQKLYRIGSREQVSSSCGRQTTGLESTQPTNLNLEVPFGKQQKPKDGHTLDQAVCRTNEKVFTSGGRQCTGLEGKEPLHLNSAVQPFGKQLPPKNGHALQGITLRPTRKFSLRLLAGKAPVWKKHNHPISPHLNPGILKTCCVHWTMTTMMRLDWMDTSLLIKNDKSRTPAHCHRV
ncbi:hypothetical protein ACA910_008290 [Epithemia clementina (nom. ined.)]